MRNYQDNENARLLGGSNSTRSTVNLAHQRNRRTMNFCVVSLVIFVISLGLLVSSVPHYGPKRNVILLISDGFGPASETFGREYYRFVNNSTHLALTPLDTILLGQSRTRSSSSLVTDSAAGATAFSCGIKTYNGAIGVDPSKKPCGTILEAAKKEGFLTGLVATSRITHATPASFSAHVPDRNMEAEIASQQLGFYPLGRNVDLMFGGGRCFFEPKTNNGSCRQDNLDLLRDGSEKGWSFITNKEEFDLLQPEHSHLLPIAGLFAPNHMDYTIDRNPAEQPSLKEMAQKALRILERATLESSQGFFLMIEGSRIDMAAHSNDPATHAHEILAYYDAVAAVKEFVSTHPETVMISVSDHETGGLTLGRQLNHTYPDYVWYPEVLSRVKSSSVNIANMVMQFASDQADRLDYIQNVIIKEYLGISDPTKHEIDGLLCNDTATIADTAADMVSRRALVGWTTVGHTGVDVNLYGYGNQLDKLFGNHENTEVGSFMVDYLGVDLQAITKELKLWDDYASLLTKPYSLFNLWNQTEVYHH